MHVLRLRQETRPDQAPERPTPCQNKPVRAARLEVPLIYCEHATKAEASRFISRFKTDLLDSQAAYKEKRSLCFCRRVSVSSTISRLCTPFAACCLAHCQCRPEALPPSSSHLCFFLAALPHLADWPETQTKIFHFHCNAICPECSQATSPTSSLVVSGHQMWHSSHTPGTHTHSPCS